MAMAGIGISLVGVFLLSGNIGPRIWCELIDGFGLESWQALVWHFARLLSRCQPRPAGIAHSGHELYQALLVAAWTLAIAVTVQAALMGFYLRMSEQANSRQWLTVGGLRSCRYGRDGCFSLLVYSDGHA